MGITDLTAKIIYKIFPRKIGYSKLRLWEQLSLLFSSSPIYIIKPRKVQLRETLRYISGKTKREIFVFPLSGVA